LSIPALNARLEQLEMLNLVQSDFLISLMAELVKKQILPLSSVIQMIEEQISVQPSLLYEQPSPEKSVNELAREWLLDVRDFAVLSCPDRHSPIFEKFYSQVIARLEEQKKK
ncbi:hypothetical protein Q7542_14290, partial [Glaesserella parasuis]|nr:hypothetical protein [Glaesserella parasuis]